jgi:hypothetical protein
VKDNKAIEPVMKKYKWVIRKIRIPVGGDPAKAAVLI